MKKMMMMEGESHRHSQTQLHTRITRTINHCNNVFPVHSHSSQAEARPRTQTCTKKSAEICAKDRPFVSTTWVDTKTRAPKHHTAKQAYMAGRPSFCARDRNV